MFYLFQNNKRIFYFDNINTEMNNRIADRKERNQKLFPPFYKTKFFIFFRMFIIE